LLPEPPTVDQIVSDLEVAGPNDVVFNGDVASLIDSNREEIPQEIPQRFSKGQSESTLYEKVIHHNQNVKRAANLKSQLPQVEDSLSQLKEELHEDRKRVTTEYKKAVQLHQEVSETTTNVHRQH